MSACSYLNYYTSFEIYNHYRQILLLNLLEIIPNHVPILNMFLNGEKTAS